MAGDHRQSDEKRAKPGQASPDAVRELWHQGAVVFGDENEDCGEDQQDEAEDPDIAEAGADEHDLPEALRDHLRRGSVEEDGRLLEEGEQDGGEGEDDRRDQTVA